MIRRVGNTSADLHRFVAGPLLLNLRLAIVRAKVTLWPGNPAIGARRLVRLVHRITDLVLRFARFTDHQQTHVPIRVVEEGMANSGAGRKSNRITLCQAVKLAGDLDVRCAFEHEHELFLGTFRVRV